MSLNIPIFDGAYRITPDEHNVIVHQRITVDPTKSPKWKPGDSTEKRIEYANPRFYPTVDVALQKTAELKVRTTEAEELKALAHEIRQIRREIRRVLAIDEEIPSDG